MPPYLEIEAGSVQDLQKVTQAIGYDWGKAIFNNAKWVLEHKYNIPLGDLKYFTFDRIE